MAEAAQDYSPAWFQQRWQQAGHVWNDLAEGADLIAQWTYENFNYAPVRHDPNLQSIVDTVRNGVDGPLKTANKQYKRKVEQRWHWTPLDQPNRDTEMHFNIKLPDKNGNYDLGYMYHVYEDGRSKCVAAGNINPQNPIMGWQRRFEIDERPQAPNH